MRRKFFRANVAAILRLFVLALCYCLVLTACRWLAFQLRFDFAVEAPHEIQLEMYWPLDLAVKLLFLFAFGQFSGLLSYFSLPDLWRIVGATTSAALALLALRLPPLNFLDAPRGVVLIDIMLATIGLVAVRLSFRVLRERRQTGSQTFSGAPRHVAIIGAGDVGANLARELLGRRGLGMQPVAFFDDDPAKWRSHVHGVPVLGPPERLREVRHELDLDEVIMAMPSAPAKRVGEVIRMLQELHLCFETVPSVDQMASGRVKVSRLRPVEVQDLLMREPVRLDAQNIQEALRNRVVLVTGAGGSIGSELCRQIAAFTPRRLLLVEQSEAHLFDIEQELIEMGFAGLIQPLVADILDQARMRHILERWPPSVLFHAAAHKHVPMMESQPGEAIKNNTLGTAALAELAAAQGVERFVLISTDKAINPTSVMGATKRLAEIFLQSLHAAQPQGTKFLAVRFGNVLGSSGSVIPTFKKQIAAGGPVRVTHPEVTRYFMTIPEAVGLVLQSTTLGAGGEIFVLDMGSPVKIVDLARQLIELSGLKPEEDIEIQFTGLRPGEKLFEELSHYKENLLPTRHPKIMRLVGEPAPLGEVRLWLAQLQEELHRSESNELKSLLKKAVPEYTPHVA